MIDLHCHSTQSDGTLTPAGLVARAETVPLTALALTDHDTVAGIPEFRAAGAGSPVQTIAGVEVAGYLKGLRMHLVGLFIDHERPELLALLSRVRQGREDRNAAILDRLCRSGCELDWTEVSAYGQGEAVGRPHFAQALIARGYCRTRKEAFDRYLARGKAAHVSRSVPPAVEVIRTIRRAGGIAIWAHPLTTRAMTGSRLERLCRELHSAGLDGLETRYSDYTSTQERTADAVAERVGLLRAGGSDFHGDTIPGVALGRGRGQLEVPDDWLPALLRAARARQSGTAPRNASGTSGPPEPLE